METESIRGLSEALKNLKSKAGFGWAMYRLPGSDEIVVIAGETTSSSFEDKPEASFIIAPFLTEKGQFFNIRKEISRLLQISDIEIIDAELPFYYLPDKNEQGSSKEYYINLVKETIAEIGSGHFKKAVPARTKCVNLDNDFSLFNMYRSLLSAYPNAFVYMLSTPQTGTWMGCTPELLLNLKDNYIETLSLAGTKKIQPNIDGEREDFTIKETEEQAIVTRYVQHIIENYCEDVKIKGPEKLKAGSIYHLATFFSGKLKSNIAGKYFQLLKDLHPTPAVCGMPLDKSRKFLLEHENFDRLLYSGFLGPVDENNAHIYVNLRCMQVFENDALLYAGAGVVQGSDPEKEWLETEEKLNTLLRFISR